MNLTLLKLNTFIPQIPLICNSNFNTIQQYLDVFYDGSSGVIITPVETSGKVKGAKGEFTTIVVDNLIVRSQYANLYENITTIDTDYYTSYINRSDDVRVADLSIGENSRFKYIDVIKPYYKISNDASVAFKTTNLGQQFQLLFDVSTSGKAFNILMDPSISGTYKFLKITAADSSMAWFTLIAVEYDSSWGTTWAIKNYGGNYSIV